MNDSEAWRRVLGRSRSAVRFGAAGATPGSDRFARRIQSSTGLAFNHRRANLDFSYTSEAWPDHGGSAAKRWWTLQRQHSLCHQVTTLDRAKLSQYIGRLTEDALAEIEEGLKAALDLP